MINEIISTLFEFVRIDSPTDYEINFSNYLKNKLEQLGLNPIQDKRGNIFVKLSGNGNSLLCSSHIDTVEPGRGIVPEINNGIISSKTNTILGSDNKVAVTVFFELIKWILNNKIKHRTLEFLFSVSEEKGVSGIDTFDFSVIESKYGITFDASMPIGTIILASPFYMSLDIEIKGKEADVSTFQDGQSVLPFLSSFLQDIPLGIFNQNTFCNIGVIRGGNSINSLLSNLSLKGEIRSFDIDDLVRYSNIIRNLLEVESKKNNCKYLYNESIENHGYIFDGNDEYIQGIVRNMNNVLPSHTVNFIEKYWGVSDANNLNNKGVTTVNLGYGNENAHTISEQINVQCILECLEFMKSYIKI